MEEAVERMGDHPIPFVAVKGDRRMPPNIAEKLYINARSPAKSIVVLPGRRHDEGFSQCRQAYAQAVSDFLAGGFRRGRRAPSRIAEVCVQSGIGK